MLDRRTNLCFVIYVEGKFRHDQFCGRKRIINELDLDGWSLRSAIHGRYVDILKFIIHTSGIYIKPRVLNSFLVDACLYGHLDVVIFLLNHGSDVNMKNHRGLTPLNAAIVTNNLKISRVLMHMIFNPKIEESVFGMLRYHRALYS